MRVIGDHEFGPKRQHHGHIVLFSVLNGLHGGFRHRLARLAAYQIGGQHQRRCPGNHRFRNAFRAQLVHVPWADGEGTLTGFAYQGKAAANRPVNALQIVEVGPAGGVAQIAVSVAANFDVAAHHAQQHRTVIGQHGVVVHGVTNRATGKLMGDQIVTHQFLIQRFGHIVFNHQ